MFSVYQYDYLSYEVCWSKILWGSGIQCFILYKYWVAVIDLRSLNNLVVPMNKNELFGLEIQERA